MSLTNPTVFGDNPQVPSANAELYVPDQLIAGDAKIVTDDTAMLTGAAALLRGTALGRVLLGATLTAAGVQATGSLTFSGNPAAGDSVTINGVEVTFVANGVSPDDFEVELGLTEAETIEALENFLLATDDSDLQAVLYSAAGSVLSLAAANGGARGNTIGTVATRSVVAAAAATLTGGANNTGTGVFSAITLGNGAKLGAYLLACIMATSGTPAASSVAESGNVGSGVMGTVTPGAAAKLGQYQVVLTATGATAAFNVIAPDGSIAGAGNVASAYNTGGLAFTLANGGTMTAGDTWNIFVTDTGVSKFSVRDPDGEVRPDLTVGTAYVDQIKTTLSQGGTKFAVGDGFSITVERGAGAYKLSAANAYDGSENPVGILAMDADPSGGDIKCAVYMTGEFNRNKVHYDPSWSLASLTTAFRYANIFLKTALSSANPT